MNSAVSVPAASAHIERQQARRLRQWTTVLALAVSDAAAFAIVHYIFRKTGEVPAITFFQAWLPRPATTTIDLFTAIAALFVFIRYIMGDYGRRVLFWDNARITTTSVLVACIPDALLCLLMNGKYPAHIFFASWLSLVVLLPLFRQIMRALLARIGLWRTPTALIGTAERLRRFFPILSSSLSLGFDVRYAIVSDGGEISAGELTGVQRIHPASPETLADQLAQARCQQIVIATGDMQSNQLAQTVRRMMEADFDVYIVPSFSHLPLAGLTVSSFFGRSILLLHVRNNLRRLPARLLKRAFDIIGAAFLLMLLSPLMLFIALAIKGVDLGPVFFVQQRVGTGGRSFPFIKFRSMRVDAEAILSTWRSERPDLYAEYCVSNFKLHRDPRLTKIGRWLRKTSLDELPQLFNVLLGQMSMVGPRPLLAREIPEYGPGIQLYGRVRPGITGLWQISGRSETTFQDRVTYDEWYILNWSFWNDLVILIQTAWIVLAGKGAY